MLIKQLICIVLSAEGQWGEYVTVKILYFVMLFRGVFYAGYGFRCEPLKL